MSQENAPAIGGFASRTELAHDADIVRDLAARADDFVGRARTVAAAARNAAVREKVRALVEALNDAIHEHLETGAVRLIEAGEDAAFAAVDA